VVSARSPRRGSDALSEEAADAVLGSTCCFISNNAKSAQLNSDDLGIESGARLNIASCAASLPAHPRWFAMPQPREVVSASGVPDAAAAPAPRRPGCSVSTSVVAAIAAIGAAAYANMYATAPGIYSLPDLMGHVRAGHFFNYHGHAIFYRTSYGGVADCYPLAATAAAAKPVLLLLHGFPTSSYDWERVWQPLAARFDLVALDFLGFGLSDKPTRYAYRLSEQASIAEALLRALNVSEYHVLAHDYGDTVAQELLARRVEGDQEPAAGEASAAGGALSGVATERPRPRLLSVALLNGGIIQEGHRPLLMQKLLVNRFAGPIIKRFAISPSVFRRSLNRVFGADTQLSPEEAAPHAALLMHKDGWQVLDSLLDYMAQRKAHKKRWVSALFDSDVPVQLVVGPADPVSGAHVVEAYAKEAALARAAAAARAATSAAVGGLAATAEHQRGNLIDAVTAARALDGTTTLDAAVGHYPQLEVAEAVVREVFAFHHRLARPGPHAG
jgi:pimeloyl-ACP methyl ester carboxylesterase